MHMPNSCSCSFFSSLSRPLINNISIYLCSHSALSPMSEKGPTFTGPAARAVVLTAQAQDRRWTAEKQTEVRGTLERTRVVPDSALSMGSSFTALTTARHGRGRCSSGTGNAAHDSALHAFRCQRISIPCLGLHRMRNRRAAPSHRPGMFICPS